MSPWARSNNSRRYAVSIIDCFSKYAWLLPITQKKAKKVLEVLRLFLKEHTPKVLQNDNGGEFTNASMKELLDNLHIKHITSLPYKPSSNGQMEQFNRTIKGMIMQYMAASNLRRYLDVLPKIVENYNNTYHTTIKSTPAVKAISLKFLSANRGTVPSLLYCQTCFINTLSHWILFLRIISAIIY